MNQAARMPRGVRNCNPGNIDRTKTVWQGEDRSAEAIKAEPRFCVFVSHSHGFRALGKTLLTYRNKHGLRTVRGIINRWAPPVENNTTAYVDAVAKAVGVKPDEVINVADMRHALPLALAIARHENGGSYWGDGVARAGLEMAGIK